MLLQVTTPDGKSSNNPINAVSVPENQKVDFEPIETIVVFLDKKIATSQVVEGVTSEPLNVVYSGSTKIQTIHYDKNAGGFVQGPLVSSEVAEGGEMTKAFAATLFFGGLTLAAWAYDHKQLISDTAGVVIDSFSSLDRATRTFKVVGSSLVACATAMDTIVKAIKENAPETVLTGNYESSDSQNVTYQLLSCGLD